MHIRVFDLLTSVEADHIEKKIDSLLEMTNTVSNYFTSQDILKRNLLNYQDNTLQAQSEKDLLNANNEVMMTNGAYCNFVYRPMLKKPEVEAYVPSQEEILDRDIFEFYQQNAAKT